MRTYPFYIQMDQMDCGPTCLKMICKSYNLEISINKLRRICNRNIDGVSLNDIAEGAEKLNFRTMLAYFDRDVIHKLPLPAIVHWNQDHFVVIYKVGKKSVVIGDPSFGIVTLSLEQFFEKTISTRLSNKDQGLILLLEPLAELYEEDHDDGANKIDILYFTRFFTPFKKYLPQIILTIIFNMGIAFCLPFISQSVMDYGILDSNFNFIILMLIFQLILGFSQMFVGFIKGRLFMHIGNRISMNLLSNFLIVLFRKPFTYFETKSIGDLTNRMGDQSSIQDFLTSSSLIIIFSSIEFIVYSILLSRYNTSVLLIFMLGNFILIGWNFLFLKKRRKFNYIGFQQSANGQNITYDLLNGVYEIKLQNCEMRQRWKWEEQQVKQFKLAIRSMDLAQIQEFGSFFIDKAKAVSISLITAALVINGNITLGVMMSISYIMGQLQGPINSLASLTSSYQNAKISLERIQEVHNSEPDDVNKMGENHILSNEVQDIEIKNLSFRYDKSTLGKDILKNISCTIPAGKVTAIVGESGSGKSTLIKVLLKIYPSENESIKINDINLNDLNDQDWRGLCGVVSQEGYIFSDTIANNIAISSAEVNEELLINASKAANIHSHVETLPLKYNTKVGKEGRKFSQGQTQRLLIARLLYKNPKYIFLDEATNSLDAENERLILDNINTLFEGRTKVIIAHRLSTIKNADQILVMKYGEIVERGTHAELISMKGYYYQLVKTQLT
ncbi:peptidase domain-containing ABC transporter [Sphingobacterium ginsenosidimutans]|uniref:peptidase domain-containing ABC transporter n=1 Tax=Sphingobacterium ginsenosidimutans TaxID=687845 RepID=UPI0031F996A4